MSWTEILGFATGAASVALAVRESAWNWPVGIGNNIFFLVLFWNTKLYADAGLQIVYVVISVFGWWNWLRGGEGKTRLSISKVSLHTALSVSVAIVFVTLGLTIFLRSFTDSSVPFLDALTTTLSLAAQYMLSSKLLENWWVWMAADLVYVALYLYKSLYLTSLLYAIFFIMCVAGYRMWNRTLTETEKSAVEAISQ